MSYKFKKGDGVLGADVTKEEREKYLGLTMIGFSSDDPSENPIIGQIGFIDKYDSFLDKYQVNFDLSEVDGSHYYMSYDAKVVIDQIEGEEETTKEVSQESDTESYDYINPSHYQNMSKEVWEMMVDVWGVEAFIAHCEMCAFKYRLRLGTKPEQPIQRDLDKANWYESKAKELKSKLNK